MKLRHSLSPGASAGLIFSLAMAACGGGASTDKAGMTSGQVTPVSEVARAVIAGTATPPEAASQAASAAAKSASATASERRLSEAAAAADSGGASVVTGAANNKVAARTSGTPTVVGAGSWQSPPGVITASLTGAAPVESLAAVEASRDAPVTPDNPAAAAAPALASSPAQQPSNGILGSAAAFLNLSTANTNPTATTTVSSNTSSCKVAFVPPSNLTMATAAARPAAGGVFFSNAELTTWKGRLTSGPFLKAGDFTKGSPGDWDRINQNAAEFIRNGDKGPQLTSAPDEYSRLGTGARDAAFLFLMTADGKAFTAVRDYLLVQVGNPAVNFPSTLCLTDKNNWNPDGYFFQGSWLLRYVVTYDFIRSALTPTERLVIDNFIRRNAYLFATQMDSALANVFPNRLKGDYSKKLWVADARNGIAWMSKRFDTNGDCKVDGSDEPKPAPVYAYAKTDGALGPRITELSQFYNNRRAAIALAYGAAGLVLADPVVLSTATRYTFQWFTYAVWPDGSQGEYARNGDYCIPQQGVIYGGANTASAALLASLLSRQGDTSIQAFSTREGLFGTEAPASAPPKTLELAIQTQLGLINGNLKWFFHQPWRDKQDFSDANAMTGFRSYYMKSTKPLENFHELGLLPATKLLPGANIAGVVLRDKAVTSLPFPGASGNSVTTGWGNWNDPFNALPAPLLTRP